MAIERPTKLYDFGSVQVAPAYEIDRQFDNHKRSIDAVIKQVAKILRADNKLNNDLLTPESFPKQILEKIQSAALSDALRAHEATAAMLREITARQIAIELSTKELRALILKNASDNQTTRAVSEGVQVSHAALSASIMSTQAEARDMLDDSFNAQNEVLRQAAVAEDWANVSIAWAEYMPGTIPPNILATNAVTGDHWSSRWWANRSANAFGMLAWWYMGAWPGPPPTTPLTPTGQPIPPGAMYFDTVTGKMYVWNGSTWISPAQGPAVAATSTLYYVATAFQTVFPLTVEDYFAASFTFNQTKPEGLAAYVNGVRVTPTLDYTVDIPSSTITFLRQIATNSIVSFDTLAPASQLAPSGSAYTYLLSPIAPDGVTTVFPLYVATTGAPVNIFKSEELLVSVDGVQQAPGAAYNASGIVIMFAQPPSADANVFIVWFGPPPS